MPPTTCYMLISIVGLLVSYQYSLSLPNARAKLRALVPAGGSPADGSECPPKRNPRCFAALVGFNATLDSRCEGAAPSPPRPRDQRQAADHAGPVAGRVH